MQNPNNQQPLPPPFGCLKRLWAAEEKSFDFSYHQDTDDKFNFSLLSSFTYFYPANLQDLWTIQGSLHMLKRQKQLRTNNIQSKITSLYIWLLASQL